MVSCQNVAALIITVDSKSPIPPFEQLRLGIRRLVATGALPVGARLPTVQQLAADLGLAPETVQRAFRELEADGVIEMRGRHGTHVLAPIQLPPPAEREARIREAAAIFAGMAFELRVPRDVALRLVGEALGPGV